MDTVQKFEYLKKRLRSLRKDLLGLVGDERLEKLELEGVDISSYIIYSIILVNGTLSLDEFVKIDEKTLVGLMYMLSEVDKAHVTIMQALDGLDPNSSGS